MPANSMWLDDVVAKLRRAEEHFDTLKNEIGRWYEMRPYRITKKVNADFTRYSQIVSITNPPDLQRWAVITSDCFHNLRSALDYLIYAVAIQESSMNPPPDCEKLQFPITDSSAIFENSRWRIKSLSPGMQTALETVQPYNRPHPSLPPLLSILRDFDNSDKHRLLHVMLTRPCQGKFGDVRNIPPGVAFSVATTSGDIVDNTEVAALVFDGPAPDVQYKFEVDFVVAMAHTASPPDSEPWSDFAAVLVRIIPEVRYIIDVVSLAVV